MGLYAPAARGGAGDARGEDADEEAPVTQGVVVPTRAMDPVLEMAGKGFDEEDADDAPPRPADEEELPQLPCLETAERDDCAVEFLSLRTRWPPPTLPALADEVPAGREG